MKIIWRLLSIGVAAGLLAGCGNTPASTSSASSPSSKSKPSPARPSPTPATPVSSGVASSAAPSASSWVIRNMDFIAPGTGWVIASKTDNQGGQSEQAVFHTTDGGHHWTQDALFTPSHPLPGTGPNPADYPGGGYLSSLDFTSAASGHAVVFLGAGACQAAYAVVSTNDGGTNWAADTSSRILGEDGPVALAFPGQSPDGWFINGSCAGAYTRVMATTDGGHTWTSLPQLATANLSPSAIAAHFSSPQDGYLVMATNGYQAKAPWMGMDVTQDGGRHWTSSPIPAKGLPDIIHEISFTSPQTGWAVASSLNHAPGLYRFTGTAWVPVKAPAAFADQPPQIDLVTRKIAYVSANTAQGERIWRTADGGASWTVVSAPGA